MVDAPAGTTTMSPPSRSGQGDRPGGARHRHGEGLPGGSVEGCDLDGDGVQAQVERYRLAVGVAPPARANGGDAGVGVVERGRHHDLRDPAAHGGGVGRRPRGPRRSCRSRSMQNGREAGRPRMRRRCRRRRSREVVACRDPGVPSKLRRLLGTQPLNPGLPARRTYWSAARSPNSGGIGPPNWLFDSARASRLARLPNSGGTGPLNLLSTLKVGETASGWATQDGV